MHEVDARAPLIGRAPEGDTTHGEVVEADVVIVGAGAAGAAAALEVDAAGGTFVGLDRLDAFGGTAATSGGGACIGGTTYQRAHGIDDSPELALRDHLAAGGGAGGGAADETWARFYYEHAEAAVHDWLVDRGVEFVALHEQENTTVARWHSPRGAGRGLMAALAEATRKRGLDRRWRFGVTVGELLTEGGRVVGAAAHQADGRRIAARGRAVVMATGGFTGNHEEIVRRADSLRGAERVLAGGGIGATGLGHGLLAAHGAAFDQLGAVFAYAHATPDPRDPTGHRGLVLRGLESAIWVNRAGRRFHDESRTGPASATPALIAQDGATCWAILDRPMLEGIRIADPAFRGGAASRMAMIDQLVASSPAILTADTPDALARAAGIDEAAFVETFRTWDRLIASGAARDPLTGRSLEGVARYGTGPYHAIRFMPLARKNLGGARTDLRGRVLNEAGRPIEGLFAAGELAGFGGGHLAGGGAIEGIMIGGSLFSGRVAGAWAAHEAGCARPEHLDADQR